MKRALIVAATIAAIGLTACGGGHPGDSLESAEKQAGEFCAKRGGIDGSFTYFDNKYESWWNVVCANGSYRSG